MKYLIIIISLLNVMFIRVANAQSQPLIYYVKNYNKTSLQARVEVNTSDLGRFIVDPSMRYVTDNKSLTPVFCADDERKINYGKVESCNLIYWFINFHREPDIGIGGRTLGNYYLNNGQWLIKESNNFPRIRNIQKAVVCIQKSCEPLSQDEVLYLIWGKAPTKVRVANRSFEVFTDRQGEIIDKHRLMVNLEPNIKYLNRVFESQLGQRITRSIRVVMLASNSPRLSEQGGSAGDHAFLVNYYVRNGRLVDDWISRTSEVILHEYIHQLAKCDSFPRWACESLADYYTYKSLAAGKPTPRGLQDWNKLKPYDPNANLGLYEIDRRYRQTRDWRYYRSFYAKGAAFWTELDLLLHQHNSSLDNYLNLLIIQPNDHIYLPQEFIDQVVSVIGKGKFSRLVSVYLN